MTATTADQFYQVQSELESGLGSLNDKASCLPGKTSSALAFPGVHFLLGDAICQWIVDTVNSFCSWLSGVMTQIWDFIKGIVAPIRFVIDTFSWLDIQKEAARISEAVDPATNTAMKVDSEWKGPAATAYQSNIKPQSSKAKSIAGTAGKVSVSLGIVGAAGLAFYIALGVIVAKLIVAAVAAIAALGSVVFSWAGLLIIVEEAAVTGAMIWAAVGAITACIGSQVQQAASIQGDIDMAFPNGTWPNPASEEFSDASMGQDATGPKDDSDWRLRP